jgi:hypothetical protein
MQGTLDIKVRPLKFALLVDSGSASQVRDAIQLASSLWGGLYFPIVPMYKRTPASWRTNSIKVPLAKDVVQGYLDAFDPDILVQFANEVPDYIIESQVKIFKPDDVWPTERNQPAEDPALGIGVLGVLSDLYKKEFKYKSHDQLKMLVPSIPRKLGLFWASVYGEYMPHLVKAVDSHFGEALNIEHPLASPEAFEEMTGQGILFPRRISAWALDTHNRLRFGREACIYFMDASAVEDVVDYWNLRATGRNVLPLPKQFLNQKSFTTAVYDFLALARRAWPHDTETFDTASFIRSRNTTMEEMSAFTKTLSFGDSQSSDVQSCHFVLQHWYPRIWDEWARSKDGGVTDHYGVDSETIDLTSTSNLNIRHRPLIPNFGKSLLYRSGGICVNEFDLRIYGADEYLAEVYPKANGNRLVNVISSIADLRGDSRIGRHGLVKIVSDSMSVPWKILAAETLFFAWLSDHGWTAELSSPGILAKQIYKRLSGFPLFLANRSILTLLEHMNGGSINRNGTPTLGGKLGAERELSVGEVKSRLNGSKGVTFPYDNFVERGVFKLGWKTKCPHCQRSSWFELSSLRETLECSKCLTSFAAAGNIEKSGNGWYYRTAGPFSVPNYADGAFSVLLTLDALSSRMFSSMSSTAVPSFIACSPGKPDLEADLAMFWRTSSYGEQKEGLLFGECKTYGAFETNDFKRMQYLGVSFPGSILVFSTLRTSLSKKEIAALTKLAKAGRKHWKNDRPLNPILILTGNELLNSARPPYCWDESVRERLSNIHDLYTLSDATQQVYLNLPSLADDWREAWEKRNSRSTK